MEFRVLGPVEVAEDARRIPLGPPRQRAVLAMLTLAAPHVVSTDRFIDGLWGEEPPARPLPALQVFVHGLRKALRPAGADGLVQRAAPGYRLAVEPSATDVGRFAALHDHARACRRDGSIEEAAAALAEALGLWRGPALADVRTAPFAAAEAVRLDELRLAAQEDWYDVRLALGQHHSLVTVLEQAVLEYPMREHLWGQLMTALYRCDRQADALATYGRARDRLADELGIDPGQALQQLELAVLRQDPELAAPAPVAAQVPVPAGGRSEREDDLRPDARAPAPAMAPRVAARVPPPSGPTFGRDALVARVGELVTSPDVSLVTLTGPGGSGKSRLAAVVALAVQDRFPAGVAYVSATEITEGTRLVRDVLHALTGSDLDVEATAGPEADALPALVVLDNLEAMPDGAQVLHQLVARGLTVLATSRLPVRLRVEHDVAVPPLEVPGPEDDLEALAACPAVQLFAARAQAADPGFRLERHGRDVAELCRFLDGFPLALELAAPHTRLLSPAAITAALRQDLGLLESRAVDVPDRQRTLAATIEWSYERLGADAQAVLGRLAMFERGFTLEAVEAICPDVPHVLEALAEVVDARLVRSVASRVEVRFVLLGTVRSFVRSRRPDAHAEEHRLLLAEHLRDRARSWAEALDGEEGTVVVGRYDDTATDLDAALAWAVDEGRADLAAGLIEVLVDLWIASGRLQDGLRHSKRAVDELELPADRSAGIHLAVGRLSYHLTDWESAERRFRTVLAAQGVPPEVEASARCHLAAVLVVTGRVDDGTDTAREALDAAERLGLYPLPAIALSVLAIGAAMTGDLVAERALLERRLDVVQQHGDLARLADTLNTLAEIALDDGEAGLAETYATESVMIAGAGLPLEARDATITLARASVLCGDTALAVERLRRAFTLADRTGQSLAIAQCLRTVGCLATRVGDPEAAVRMFAAAQRLSPSPSGSDEPIEQDFAEQLGEARLRLGDIDFQRSWALGRTLPVPAVRRQVEALLDQGASVCRS